MPYVMEQHDDLYTSLSGLGQAHDEARYGTRATRWAAVKDFRSALHVASAPGKEGVYDAPLHAAARACLPVKWQAEFDRGGPAAIRVCGTECRGKCPYPDQGVIQAYNVFKEGKEQLPPDDAELFQVVERPEVRPEPTRPSTQVRSQKDVVKAVQRVLRVGVDGSYGSGTNTALQRWASGKGVTNFAAAGPGALLMVYKDLTLNNLDELNLLANAWKAWKAHLITPPRPTPGEAIPADELYPPTPEDVTGGAQPTGFVGWLGNYWWVLAAVAVVGVGGYVIWKRHKAGLPERAMPFLPVPEEEGA